MKDYLETFETDITMSVREVISLEFGPSFESEMTHTPTNIYSLRVTPKDSGYSIQGTFILLKIRLKSKLKVYFQQKESVRFSAWLKDRMLGKTKEKPKCLVCGSEGCVSQEAINFYDGANPWGVELVEEIKKRQVASQMKETKKPVHPGDVVKDLLLVNGCTAACFKDGYKDGKLYTSVLNIKKACELLELGDEDGIKQLLKGNYDIDYMMAGKLAKVIKGTDILFWMDLQEKYDEWNESQNV